MNKAFAILTAVALGLASAPAFADDQTPSNFSPAEQAKMKQEADAKKAAAAKMTPEEKAAAKKAKAAEALKNEATIEKITQNPGDARNMGINKSAADSKAGPPPNPVNLNTPEVEQKLLKQKGQ
jgi:hypothetical protein